MSSDDRKDLYLDEGVTKTDLVNALDEIHKTIKEDLSAVNANLSTEVHINDSRELKGFIESCRLLASFAVQNNLKPEAIALVQLARNGSEHFIESIKNEKGLVTNVLLGADLISALESIEIAILSLESTAENGNHPIIPFEVWPESSENSESESIVFDPGRWNLVAKKEFLDGWESIEGFFSSIGEEVLYTDDSSNNWIVIRSQCHNECPDLESQTYYHLAESRLPQWIKSSQVIPPYSLEDLIPEHVLSPCKVAKPVYWDGNDLFVNGVSVANFSSKAKMLRIILNTFEEDEWSEKIDDPLPGVHVAPESRLRDKIRDLNKKQNKIRFSSSDSGQAIKWKFV